MRRPSGFMSRAQVGIGDPAIDFRVASGYFMSYRYQTCSIIHTMDLDTASIDAQIAKLQAERQRKIDLADRARREQEKQEARVLIGSTPTKKKPRRESSAVPHIIALTIQWTRTTSIMSLLDLLSLVSPLWQRYHALPNKFCHLSQPT